MIHKILEHESNAFIISETSLHKGSAPVLSMKLHSEKVQPCSALNFGLFLELLFSSILEIVLICVSLLIQFILCTC